MVDIADPELRIVTSFDEWLHLRRNCRPCVGELGSEPVEADMFDQDSEGRVQIVLLANETLHIPFTFLTLVPYTGKIQSLASNKILSSRKEDQKEDFKENDLDDVHRIVNVKFISGSHGHLISILKVQIHPRPLILNRVIRFYESENSIMKRRIQLIGHPNDGHYESLTPATKYVHCVEGTDGSGSAQNRVVIEWGPSGGENDLIGNLDILLRYRCGSFPFHGSFFILVYSDPYQTNLFEVLYI